MEVIPVLDLLRGAVVRGVAGQRESYQPVQSRLTPTPEPLAVAAAMRETLGLHRLYVADLDAIEHDAPDWPTIEQLCSGGCELLVDAGLREPSRAARLIDAGVARVVVALETVPGPRMLTEIVSSIGPERAVFSLDLRQGRPLADPQAWGTSDPFTLVMEAAVRGVTSFVVLDLAGVGVDEGVRTLPLCRRLREAGPALTILTGGGVRSLDDLRELQAAGVDGVLIASALHSEAIGRVEMDALSDSGPA